MTPTKKEDQEPKPPAPEVPAQHVGTCNWCEKPTTSPGHIVNEAGKVVQCPTIDMVVGGESLGGMR